MKPHELRVIEERNSLDAKRTKLYEFTRTPGYEKLSSHERDLLEIQRQVMRVYSSILSIRIANFVVENLRETPIADTAEADKGMAEA